MFFIFSKILGYLVRPLVLIFILFATARFIRNQTWKKRIYFLAFSLCLFFSNDFISNEIMQWWEVPATRYESINKTYEIGIVLTGVTKSNTFPTDRIHFHRGADRVTHALQLYRLGIIKNILISGGSGTLTSRTPEADELFQVFTMMGVAPDDILIENQSNNTYQSAIAVKDLLMGKVNSTDCLLITSAYHIRRARACFTRVGFATDTFSVDFLSHNRVFTPDVLFVPKLEAWMNWQTLFKEWVGMIAYRAAGYI